MLRPTHFHTAWNLCSDIQLYNCTDNHQEYCDKLTLHNHKGNSDIHLYLRNILQRDKQVN